MEGFLLKLTLTALAASGYWYSLTPPSYPSQKDTVHVDGFFGFVAHKLSVVSKIAVVSQLTCQIIVIAALSYPSTKSLQALPYLCKSANPHMITSLSPQFLLGSFVVISMTLIRAWCFHALGRLFTFQIAIRNNHRLVRTGPYACVRHPGYTSLISVIVGVILMSLDERGWIRQCNMMDTQVRWWVYLYICLCAFSIKSMIGRGRIEDDELRKVFHEDWMIYKREVPYQFIPGVL